jgi:site-specific DNA-methyltransferase (adenine-specific)
LFPQSKAGKDTGKSGTGGIWNSGNGIPIGPQYGDNGSAARFFYCAKASPQDRNDGLSGFAEKKVGDGRKKDSDAPQQRGATLRKNTHPTVKPTDLMRYLCKMITPTGGTILDPFMGSGSTGRGAVLEGFNFIGIEMNNEYIDIAKARIAVIEKKIAEEENKVNTYSSLFEEE